MSIRFNLDHVLTTEMSQGQWDQFRKDWIKSYAESLVTECGQNPVDAIDIADVRFEDYVGQEGWHGRDERIICDRDGWR